MWPLFTALERLLSRPRLYNYSKINVHSRTMHRNNRWSYEFLPGEGGIRWGRRARCRAGGLHFTGMVSNHGILTEIPSLTRDCSSFPLALDAFYLGGSSPLDICICAYCDCCAHAGWGVRFPYKLHRFQRKWVRKKWRDEAVCWLSALNPFTPVTRGNRSMRFCELDAGLIWAYQGLSLHLLTSVFNLDIHIWPFFVVGPISG